jgi:hypothetical protein
MYRAVEHAVMMVDAELRDLQHLRDELALISQNPPTDPAAPQISMSVAGLPMNMTPSRQAELAVTCGKINLLRDLLAQEEGDR